jgi:hypothetical protein
MAAAILLILACAIEVPPAAAQPSDDELIKLCVAEVLSQEGQDTSGGAPKIVSSEVTRAPNQEVVQVQLTLAEGRLLGGRCVIRNGKIFDFRS